MPAATFSKYTLRGFYCYPTAYEAVHQSWSEAICILICWREINLIYAEKVISTFDKHIAIQKQENSSIWETVTLMFPIIWHFQWYQSSKRNQENIFVWATFSHFYSGSDFPLIQLQNNHILAIVSKAGRVKPGWIWPFCLCYLYFLYSKAQGDTWYCT